MGYPDKFSAAETVLAQLPYLDVRTAELQRAACREGSDLAFSYSDDGRFKLARWIPAAPGNRIVWTAGLTCRDSLLRFSFTDSLLAESATGVNFEAFPNLLQRAYATHILRPLIDAFSGKIGEKVEVASLTRAWLSLSAPGLGLEVRDERGNITGTGILQGDLDEAPWQALFMRSAPRAPEPLLVHPVLANLALSLRVEIGAAQLSLQEISTLRIRDVLLIQQLFSEQESGQAARICLPVRPLMAARVRRTVDGFKVMDLVNIMKQKETPMNVDGNHVAPQLDLDQIPVNLTFSVGEVSVSMAEINGLRPGSVFAAIQQDNAAQVTVLANGKSFATGELVNVGGRIGVRIQRILSDG